ncbi:hypothetical protein SK128_027803, partial [Halocaridina rubra]
LPENSQSERLRPCFFSFTKMEHTKTDAENTVTPQSIITEDNVARTLLADKGLDAQLTSYKVVDFTKRGDNYASVVSSVEVNYLLHGQENTINYIVKLNPCRSFQNLEELNHVMFTKEGKFYQILVPEINSVLEKAGREPLHLPRCFHVDYTNGREQIYLEDMRAKGFSMFDRRQGLSKEHTELVLKELARLHSASFVLKTNLSNALSSKDDFLQKDFLTYISNCDEAILQAMKGHLVTASDLLQRIGGYEKAVSWVEGLKPKLAALLTTGLKSEHFDGICHGDCWNNNLLFRYNEDGHPIDVILLDLQVCRQASIATDLNYLLFTSLTGKTRKLNLRHFLLTYFSAYKEVLENAGLPMYFTEEELIAEYREKNTFGAYVGMMIIPAVLIEPADVPDMSDEVIDLEKITQEFREKIVSMLDKNPLIKPRFLDIFDELIETGLIS